MLIINIVAGILLAGIGLSVEKHPGWLLRYSLMSEEKKKNVEIDKILALNKRTYMWLAALLIACSVLLYLVQLDRYFEGSMMLVLLGGTIFLFNAERKYNHNAARRSIIIAVNIFYAVVTIVYILMMFWMFKPYTF